MKLKISLSIILFYLINFLNAQPIQFKNVKKILFLGNSITYAGNYVVDIETWILIHYPNTNYEFINMGLPSETASGLSEVNHAGGKYPRPNIHERLDRVLNTIKPDLVFACYGMNDGIYMPFDETRFNAYKDGINYIRENVLKANAKLILVTPPIYDELKGKKNGYAEVLDKYSDWLLAQRANNWDVIDTHYPMKKVLEAHRKLDEQLKVSTFAFAEDGVHPTEAGHWIIAKNILLYLQENVDAVTDIKTGIVINKNGEKILKLVAQRQSIMKDAFLTAVGHKRLEMKVGLPIEEAKVKYNEIELEIRELLK